jgi:prophage maintenance system killer protein
MKDKFNMTQEENIYLAKRNIVDSMWKSANLEGIAITFPETQAIYDGMNIGKFRIDEIQTINNLKHAWQFVIASILQDIDFNYLSSINSLVGSNIVDMAGKMRIYDVAMGGTTWKPELPTLEKIEDILFSRETYESVTEKILIMMCRLMKLQVFNDGNKRTAMLIANHELIKNGKGILSISDDVKIEFGTRLIKYYENENELNNLLELLYNNCLDGIRIK